MLASNRKNRSPSDDERGGAFGIDAVGIDAIAVNSVAQATSNGNGGRSQSQQTVRD
jgi:hypothetical protein